MADVYHRNQRRPRHATILLYYSITVITWVTPRQTRIITTMMYYMTRLCGTVRPRPFLRLSSTTPSKTAAQKSKGVSRPSPKVQYLSLPTYRSQTWLQYQFARTAPSRFTESESVVPQPSDKNAIDRPPGCATPLERFFSQYPKFQFRPSESPTSEFKRLCKDTRKMLATNSMLPSRGNSTTFMGPTRMISTTGRNSVVPCELNRFQTRSKNAAL